MYYKMLEFDRPVSECRNFLFWWIDPGEKEHRGLQHHQEEIMKGKKVQFLERLLFFSPRLRLIRQVLQ